MAVKLRDQMWGHELGVSIVFLIISIVGMCMMSVAVAQLPKCKYGDVRCYFFFKVCSESYFNSNGRNPYTCAWVSKNRAIEGSSDSGVEQLALPLAATIMALIPAITLVITTVIRNERVMLGLLEAGKAFIVFNCIILAVACAQINKLTFDCRWYPNEYTGNYDNCTEGFVKFIAGSCIIFVCQLVLLGGIIMYGENERRRVRGDCVESFGPGEVVDEIGMGGRVG